MTATLTKPEKLVTAVIDDDLSAAGYSDKEISLIGYCWQDAEAINKNKTSLAMHLWELKQEMDANDPNAGSGGGNGNGSQKSRFWSAFDSGHLPYAGDKGRRSTETCLIAAQFLESGALRKDLRNALCNLAPATLYEISNLEEPAQKLVYKAIESSDFIGVAAVRLIAHEGSDDVFDKLAAWIESHPAKAITPKTIRELKEQVKEENSPPSSRTVELSLEEQEDVFSRTMSDLRSSRPQREQQARIDAVKDELSRSDRERLERLNDKARKYNSHLNAAISSVHELLVFLQTIDRVDGTQYLDELRCFDGAGLVTVRDDLPRLQKVGEDLMAAVRLANSCNPPTGIDMSTFTVDAE